MFDRNLLLYGDNLKFLADPEVFPGESVGANLPMKQPAEGRLVETLHDARNGSLAGHGGLLD